MNSVYKTYQPEQTMELGRQLAARLQAGSVVLLYGDLGSGKTHFTKGLAEGLGIREKIKSPTFTYVNSYQCEVRSQRYEQNGLAPRTSHLALYHYDLYRLQLGEALHSIGLEDTLNDPQAINVIEWADRLGESLPKDYIKVELKVVEKGHEIQITFQDSEVVPLSLVEEFYEKWVTPLHVRAHCQKVAQVAQKIGQAFIDKNKLLDLNLLHTAALLHDMARVCDFLDLDPNKFQEEITEEKWAQWLQLRQEYEGQNHAHIAAEALFNLGYQKTASLIRYHHSLALLKASDQFDHLETAILYYADKRVKHDQIVSLAERFQDGRERYGHHDNEAQKKLYLEVEKKTFKLEEKLFSQIELDKNTL